MAIRINTWRPATCECVLHYQFDTEDQKENKTLTPLEKNGFEEATVRCEIHKGITDLNELHEAVRKFNLENPPVFVPVE